MSIGGANSGGQEKPKGNEAAKLADLAVGGGYSADGLRRQDDILLLLSV